LEGVKRAREGGLDACHVSQARCCCALRKHEKKGWGASVE
jgi:hypothetical protein